MEAEPRIVLTTAPNGAVARTLARGLVERRLAACVNILPGIASVYRWEGAVREEREVLLIVKSTAERVGAIEAWLAEAHPYDVPECVSLAAASVETKYLQWMLDETEA